MHRGGTGGDVTLGGSPGRRVVTSNPDLVRRRATRAEVTVHVSHDFHPIAGPSEHVAGAPEHQGSLKDAVLPRSKIPPQS